MGFRRVLFPMLLACVASPAIAANLHGDMRTISAFCLNYLETGQAARVLLDEGFNAKGRKYKKSYSKSMIGGFNPVITVDPRKTRSGLSCSAQFGIIKQNDGYGLIEVARQQAAARGYRPVTVTDSKGRQSSAYSKDGIFMRIGGRSTYSNSTYSTFLYFERLN